MLPNPFLVYPAPRWEIGFCGVPPSSRHGFVFVIVGALAGPAPQIFPLPHPKPICIPTSMQIHSRPSPHQPRRLSPDSVHPPPEPISPGTSSSSRKLPVPPLGHEIPPSAPARTCAHSTAQPGPHSHRIMRIKIKQYRYNMILYPYYWSSLNQFEQAASSRQAMMGFHQIRVKPYPIEVFVYRLEISWGNTEHFPVR